MLSLQCVKGEKILHLVLFAPFRITLISNSDGPVMADQWTIIMYLAKEVVHGAHMCSKL